MISLAGKQGLLFQVFHAAQAILHCLSPEAQADAHRDDGQETETYNTSLQDPRTKEPL